MKTLKARKIRALMFSALITASHKLWLETCTVPGSCDSVGKWHGCAEHVWKELDDNFFEDFFYHSPTYINCSLTEVEVFI